MLISKEDAAKEIEYYLNQSDDVTGREDYKKIYTELNYKHNIPINITTDILNGERTIKDCSPFIIYCLVEKIRPSVIPKWFTKNDINDFKDKKYFENKIKLPLSFNAIDITEDQWTTKINFRYLVEMKNCNFIRYNERTQRTPKQKNGYFEIDINLKTIKEIRDKMKRKIYIPTPITLNIPEDADVSYLNGILALNHLDHLDILDGYHRLAAAEQQCQLDTNFDYVTELRIVQYNESKAKQFIYQEDQKTKMKKIDSDSFNQENFGNLVSTKLNEDRNFYLCGEITETGKLKYSYFAKIVNILFSNKKNGIDNKEIIRVKKFLFEKINSLIEEDPDTFLEKEEYTYGEIYIMLYLIKNEKKNLKNEIVKCFEVENQIGIYHHKNKVAKIIEDAR